MTRSLGGIFISLGACAAGDGARRHHCRQQRCLLRRFRPAVELPAPLRTAMHCQQAQSLAEQYACILLWAPADKMLVSAAGIRLRTCEEAVCDEAAGACAAIEGGEAGQRLACQHARHAPALQLLCRVCKAGRFRGRTAASRQAGRQSCEIASKRASSKQAGNQTRATQSFCTSLAWQACGKQCRPEPLQRRHQAVRAAAGRQEQCAHLLAQEAGNLGVIDQGALGASHRHGAEEVAREGLGLPRWQACLHILSSR